MTQDGTEVTCSTCVHYRRTGDARYGVCRRWPPVWRDDDDRSAQPIVDDIDTCGEWRQKRETA